MGNITGAHKENKDLIRDVLDETLVEEAGNYAFQDSEGNVFMFGKDNSIHTTVNGKLTKLDISKYHKENGYIYTKVVAETGKVITYGIHDLVALIHYRDEYDDLEDTIRNYKIRILSTSTLSKKEIEKRLAGTMVIPNHKNNIRWDNRKENIEITTQRYNVLHGYVVASIHHYQNIYERSNLENPIYNRYGLKGIIVKNGNKTRQKEEDKLIKAGHNGDDAWFKALNKGISCSAIRAFEQAIGTNDIKEYLGINKNNIIIDEVKLLELLDFICR